MCRRAGQQQGQVFQLGATCRQLLHLRSLVKSLPEQASLPFNSTVTTLSIIFASLFAKELYYIIPNPVSFLRDFSVQWTSRDFPCHSILTNHSQDYVLESVITQNPLTSKILTNFLVSVYNSILPTVTSRILVNLTGSSNPRFLLAYEASFGLIPKKNLFTCQNVMEQQQQHYLRAY